MSRGHGGSKNDKVEQDTETGNVGQTGNTDNTEQEGVQQDGESAKG